MSNKTILGLDLGTNSIGWALTEQNLTEKQGKILGMGSRIIPMDQGVLGEFDKGNSVSQTAARTGFRTARRLRERYLLRRERLHRVLNVLGFLPTHFAEQIDFEKRLGQFKTEAEPKIAYHNNQFIFRAAFEEMLEDFKKHQPELLNRLNRKGEPAKIPYDWTIYYLRKKALIQKIEKEELAWVLLSFNQKRGYYQLRGEEEEENPNKLVEYHSLRVIDVTADENQKSKDDTWYSLHLENGWIYRRSSKTPLFDWRDKTRDFIVTTDLNDDGSVKTDKEGKEKRSFRAPGENDWTLLKKKTEQDIELSNKTVGTYIYDSLLQNPDQKIKGKLIRTIERKYYRNELKSILERQIELHPELRNETLFADCVRELYRNNESHRQTIISKGFLHLLLDDIIFYQRPLRSKKSSIGNCSLEKRLYKDADGNEQTVALKAIPKSNPVYQEFRIWKWLHDLSIYRREDELNVTGQFLKSWQDYEKLFEELSSRKEIKQEALLKYLIEQTGLKGKTATAEASKYRWNYVEDKIYPLNETRTLIINRLEKVNDLPANFLTPIKEQQLWHIIYAVTDKTEYEKAVKSFARKNKLDESSFMENFKKIPPFKSDYASYSEKAIKKLLPLMRVGKFWNWEGIDKSTRERIDKLLTGEYDANISNRVRERVTLLTDQSHFQGLADWLAKYVIYGFHSEASDLTKWNNAQELGKYINEFRQHSLRNPIVEQVVTETLRVVKDIWQYYGEGKKDFFNEIHVELGRDMKRTSDERKDISKQNSENENTNLRLKALLAEMLQQGDVENVRPHSPTQLEILKIYEDGVLNSTTQIPDDIIKISKTAQPTSKELLKYKLWLEQKYRSPYTGEVIPLNKLFTSEYEIEHIIPQSRYFDNSFGNKVICEAAVNKLKDNQLGLEFIKNHHGEKVETGFGKTVMVFEEVAYLDFVKNNYAKSRGKKTKLLMEDIPEKMIERQLNDTRYISKFISSILSGIVREDTNDDGINSKNLVPVNGTITAELRHDWGLDDVWNDLILPRFERMNELTKSTAFTAYSKVHQKYIPAVPLELSKGFQKKRIDHRHHALDALVIACTTRDHVNLLNNVHANSDTKRYDLQRKLRKLEKVKYFNKKENREIERSIPKDFIKPWTTFTAEAKDKLESIIVSFKQNLRVINKTSNKYEKWVEKDGAKTKQLVPQTKGDSWAIRKSLHKATVSGKVNLQGVKVPKGKILTASRKNIDTSFDLDTIKSITDSGIQKILKNYLTSKGGNPEVAFSPEGLEDMNKNITHYNDGKPHKPIYKVRIFEKGGKFQLGVKNNKHLKFTEAADGTNLFFAVYVNEKGERTFETIPLNEVIEHQKWRASLSKEEQEKVPLIPTKAENGTYLFNLSPNDLVYLPSQEDREHIKMIDFRNLNTDQKKRIWTVNDFSTAIYFRPNRFSKAIGPKEVDLYFNTKKNKLQGSFDYKTASYEGEQIRDFCIKIKVDRLGNIIASGNTSDFNDDSMRAGTTTVSEPTVPYSGSKKIIAGLSPDDSENTQLKYWAGLTPQQRFAGFYELMTRFYTFLKPDWSTKKITIDL
ncbi:MAG: type II CRISPR RNA-guided endonuclease Cas9 [Cyclobacteriaceae bacterium]|nr:type II CRISPR RNA-guided endonuclease Cas9 [Cyclobacteriaceae bacterium]